ncbi:S-adenosylmethionine-diacylglycerol 3-amino-3-carboxypropyl transferase [Haloferula luteola]|uniref:S-adenosylmethionine-diacylglycerol 3-amino-3-carboxypropyl transferase n=1 Tax=Haloferula luteola TaxID=595692 RepID=A0A840V9I2_9BACT|nr:DUF3419 family protein [Haloferula luteola]MBB5352244.1 S-adenosylmethionine-diacylglycerol 3-amino-3-carboxypropyl transferase [Haloferula luteola]
MKSEIEQRAAFERLRYGQCWEDAAVLVKALDPRGRRCVSIGSAGDNSFALLAAGAERVDVVEMNPAQVAAIELRKAGYLHLDYEAFGELLGVRRSRRRREIWRKIRGELSPAVVQFWERQSDWWEVGAVGVGRFENYFKVFRDRVLPLAHSRGRVLALLQSRDRKEREVFYQEIWNNRRWRWIFQLFFSRRLMGFLGRDPEFFKYVEGSVAARILERTRHALVELDPAVNPYLRWILTGEFEGAWPIALEEGNFERIGGALREGRMEIHEGSLESWLERNEDRWDAFNLSDIFEYMSEANSAKLYEGLLGVAAPGARIAYWNMLVPRSCPEALMHRVETCEALGETLWREDRAFFYNRLIVEEVRG